MTKRNPLPSQELLNSLLYYDQSGGLLYWKNADDAPQAYTVEAQKLNAIKGVHSGVRAVACLTNGYRRGPFQGKSYQAHRIIWKMVHGVDPDIVDHINGDKADNRIENLRNVTTQENARNRRLRPENHKEYVDRYWRSSTSEWVEVVVDTPPKNKYHFCP